MRTYDILLVEDNDINRELAYRILSLQKYTVDTANDGQQAIDKLNANNNYNLILMDCQMPVLDGYEATRRIRKDLQVKTPIIAVTAHALHGDREKCMAAGMDDYISKPISKEHFLGKVDQWISQSQMKITIDGTAVAPTSTVSPIVAVGQDPDEFLLRLKKLKSDYGIETVISLLNLFKTEYKDKISKLIQSCQLNDQPSTPEQRAQIKYLAHYLKSGCLNLGLSQMSAFCAQMEEHSERAENAHLFEWAMAIYKEYVLALDKLKGFSL